MHMLDIVTRVILVLASAASFIPQLQLLRNRANCDGISLFYLLFDLIVATHDLALLVSAIIDSEGNFLIHQPPAVQDWLNLAQFSVTWVGQLLLGYYILALPPHRPAQSRVAITTYLSYLAISLVPAIAQAFIPLEDRELLTAILVGTLLYLFGPIVQFLGFAALTVQARQTISRGSAGALSIKGLVLQAVIYLLVGISFLFRLRTPSEELDEHWIVNVRDWYWTVGWAMINNVIFAVSQGILACVVLRRGREEPDERSALLS